MSSPETPPPLVDQDEMPYGRWRAIQETPTLGWMEWEFGNENPTGEMRRLYDQQHEAGSWWAGTAQSMNWMPNTPAPAPNPEWENEENSNG